MVAKERERKCNLPDGLSTMGPYYIDSKTKTNFFNACKDRDMTMDKGFKYCVAQFIAETIRMKETGAIKPKGEATA